VNESRFRRDLYHRLEVFIVAVPPLRDRKADIAAISRHLLSEADGALGRKVLTSAAIARLLAYDWPGNVRELRNVLYRASDVAGEGELLDAEHIERGLRNPSSRPPRPMITPADAQCILAEHDHNLSAAARAAGYPRTSFRKLLTGG
jgi:two-component system response regulator AtoC